MWELGVCVCRLRRRVCFKTTKSTNVCLFHHVPLRFSSPERRRHSTRSLSASFLNTIHVATRGCLSHELRIFGSCAEHRPAVQARLHTCIDVHHLLPTTRLQRKHLQQPPRWHRSAREGVGDAGAFTTRARPPRPSLFMYTTSSVQTPRTRTRRQSACPICARTSCRGCGRPDVR